MNNFLSSLSEALLMSLGMFWQIGWSLALGFTITSVIEVAVSQDKIMKRFGKSGFREIAFATFFGAISSSCSYAAASTSRALFKKGASFISSMAFLFSSTNLVIELGVILWLLMGWQFAIAEWLGGIVLIALMSFIVKLTYPKKMIEDARAKQQPAQKKCCGMDEMNHDHMHMETMKDNNAPAQVKIFDPQTQRKIAGNYFMEWSMLWKDLLIGLLIAGVIAAFVPQSVFDILFFKNASPVVRELVSAFIGPVIAIITFVCSIGNVPLAAIFWSQGMGFSGVISFLYADLIVIPLLDVYRKYYGWKLTWYIFIVFFITMIFAGLIMSLPFTFFHLIPKNIGNVRSELMSFKINYTFYLNIIFGLISLYFFLLGRRKSVPKVMHAHH
ncbi:MAG TPA: permease [Puia sp.]|nr:permease [Puia sp.]